MDKVYVRKEYYDEYAYGEELIEVYSSPGPAIEKIKDSLLDFYGSRYGYESFEELVKNKDDFMSEDDTFRIDETSVYVSIGEGIHYGTHFWVLKEYEVQKR